MADVLQVLLVSESDEDASRVSRRVRETGVVVKSAPCQGGSFGSYFPVAAAAS